jgi:putative restriction endonuclease
MVPNGLALCGLHHGAFDSHILGIRPDLVIDVRKDVLHEPDGPMLRHGLQGFYGQAIQVPRIAELRPSKDLLAERYELFKKAG